MKVLLGLLLKKNKLCYDSETKGYKKNCNLSSSFLDPIFNGTMPRHCLDLKKCQILQTFGHRKFWFTLYIVLSSENISWLSLHIQQIKLEKTYDIRII